MLFISGYGFVVSLLDLFSIDADSTVTSVLTISVTPIQNVFPTCMFEPPDYVYYTKLLFIHTANSIAITVGVAVATSVVAIIFPLTIIILCVLCFFIMFRRQKRGNVMLQCTSMYCIITISQFPLKLFTGQKKKLETGLLCLLSQYTS